MVEKDPYGDNTVEIELEKIKLSLGINKPNSDLSHEEFKLVIQKFGEREPDVVPDENGVIQFGPKAIDAMLVVTLYYFPRFYDGLTQPQ